MRLLKKAHKKFNEYRKSLEVFGKSIFRNPEMDDRWILKRKGLLWNAFMFIAEAGFLFQISALDKGQGVLTQTNNAVKQDLVISA